MRRRYFFAAYSICLIALMSTPGIGLGQEPLEQGRIQLADVTGSVTVLNNTTGQSELGRNGFVLTQGYSVSTGRGSSAILLFGNGSVVTLREKSNLSVDQFLQSPFEASNRTIAEMKEEPSTSQTELKLEYGEIIGNVKKLKSRQGSKFVVNTPAGAAGIRGTDFLITVIIDLITGEFSVNFPVDNGNMWLNLIQPTVGLEPAPPPTDPDSEPSPAPTLDTAGVELAGGNEVTLRARLVDAPDGSGNKVIQLVDGNTIPMSAENLAVLEGALNQQDAVATVVAALPPEPPPPPEPDPDPSPPPGRPNEGQQNQPDTTVGAGGTGG